MSETEALFRAEALEHRARGRDGPGGVLRLGGRWLRRSYWLTLALVVAGTALAATIRTSESTTGPAVVDLRTGRFSSLVPAAVAVEIPRARTARLELPGGAVAVKVLRAKPVGAGTRVAGLPASRQAAILLSGRLATAGSSTRAGAGVAHRRARMTIVLRSERVGAVLIRQFKGMLGDGGAGA
jgi:hypothetical protein